MTSGPLLGRRKGRKKRRENLNQDPTNEHGSGGVSGQVAAAASPAYLMSILRTRPVYTKTYTTALLKRSKRRRRVVRAY